MTNQEKIQECKNKIANKEKELKRLQKTYKPGDVLYSSSFEYDTKVIVATFIHTIVFYNPYTNFLWRNGEKHEVSNLQKITREELDDAAGMHWDTKDE